MEDCRVYKEVRFNLVGYDPFIDFIKAYAIICVLIGHTIPYVDYWGYGLWAGMQVPLFVLVQSFHVLKRDSSANITFCLNKIVWRVLIPFLFIQFIVLIFILCTYDGIALHTQLVSFMKSGGKGPGSYYPWIYIQIALLLPFINKLMSKGTKRLLTIASLIICELFEIVFSLIDLPDFIYRLLAVRYFFLFYLAWLWVKEGIIINRLTILLSTISFLSIIYFEYFSINDEILFCNTAWKYHRWPCYYFVAMGGVLLLNYAYKFLSKTVIIDKTIKKLAKCSYEIFLIQMLVIYIYPDDMVKTIMIDMGIVSSLIAVLLAWIVKIVIVFAISILAGYYFNVYYNRFVKY